MLENDLKDKLKSIFSVKDATFDAPGELREQDKLFIEVETSRSRVSDGKHHAMVTGRCFIFGQNDKLKIGFFDKRLKEADYSLTKHFHFSDFETNTNYYRNLVERSFSFTYFFNGQYDPETGKITSIDFKGD